MLRCLVVHLRRSQDCPLIIHEPVAFCVHLQRSQDSAVGLPDEAAREKCMVGSRESTEYSRSVQWFILGGPVLFTRQATGLTIKVPLHQCPGRSRIAGGSCIEVQRSTIRRQGKGSRPHHMDKRWTRR